MNKYRWMLVVALVAVLVVLGACGPTPTDEGTPEPTTEAPVVDETPEEPVDEPTPVEMDVVEPEVAPGLCELAPMPELDVPPVTEDDNVKGAEDATITIFEYSDFQCPGCGGMAPIVEAFVEDHPEMRLVYRHYPLDFHERAFLAAEASEAAAAQGKFWEMHDKLFETAQVWGAMDEEAAIEEMATYAEALDLNVDQFVEDLEEGTHEEEVQEQYDAARSLGLGGTPSFIFDNIPFPSDMGLSYSGLEGFLQIIQNRDEIFFDEIPEMTVEEDETYVVTLETTQGEIIIELLPETAPTHVNNFLFLAREGWYDGSEFFLVQDNFVAATGDPTNTSYGYPGYYCTGEDRGVFAEAGIVGMLPSGQFFITLGEEAAQLSGRLPQIGRVVEGEDVLNALARVAPGAPDAEADMVESVTVDE